VEDDYARGCFLIPNSKLGALEAVKQEHLLRREASAPPAVVSDEQLQAAARLKVVLGSGRTAAVAGIAEEDCPSEVAWQIAQAFATTEHKPALIVTAESLKELADPAGVECERSVLDSAEALGGNVYRIHSGALGVLREQDVEAGRKRLRLALADFCLALVDCGNLRRNPSGLLLASLTGGVVIAARAGKRRRHELTELREDLQRLQIPLLGVFLTRGASPAE
jgi:hypothetical protein